MKKNRTITLLDTITEEMEGRKSTACIGQIAGTNDHGQILVRYGENTCHPARLVAPLKRYELGSDSYLGREVLLTFEEGDRERPIIIALMSDPVEDLADLAAKKQKPQEMIIDGKTITIEAQDEILLKCGPGSICLTKDGKIILKGIEIVSRAKETNKVKGAKVEMN